jgi:hypothetical protein
MQRLHLILVCCLLWASGCARMVERVLEQNFDENLEVDVQLGSQTILPDDLPIAIDEYKMLRVVSHVLNKEEGRRQTRVLIMSSLKEEEAKAFYRKSMEDAGYTVEETKDVKLLHTSVVYRTVEDPGELLVGLEREHGKMMITILYTTSVTQATR